MSKVQDELKTWYIAAFIVVAIAASVFVIQHFASQIFDTIFEICVFYIPAVSAVAILLYFRNKPIKQI